ncbi:MAG: hypothetical protein ACRENS_07580, partial [Candidatus Eiseniibacteriota bacterium]
MNRRCDAARVPAAAIVMSPLAAGARVMSALMTIAFVVSPLVAFALSGSAGASSTVAIPGSTLSLGMRLSRVDSLVAFRIAGRPVSVNKRTGRSRYFGLDAASTLDFDDGRLRHAHFEIQETSTHSRDYVEDQLRRLGLKPSCEAWDDGHHSCTWNGACNLRVVWQPGVLKVDATAPASWASADSA